MRLLHISDSHFSEKSEQDQSVLVDALLRDLDPDAQVGVDVVIFSGDLTFSAQPAVSGCRAVGP